MRNIPRSQAQKYIGAYARFSNEIIAMEFKQISKSGLIFLQLYLLPPLPRRQHRFFIVFPAIAFVLWQGCEPCQSEIRPRHLGGAGDMEATIHTLSIHSTPTALKNVFCDSCYKPITPTAFGGSRFFNHPPHLCFAALCEMLFSAQCTPRRENKIKSASHILL